MKGGRRAFLILGIVLFAVLAIIFTRANPQNRLIDGYETTQLKSGGRTYTLLLANDPAKQSKGLGLRDSLPSDQGMLFPFGSRQKLCFWMKDMRFPIDMIWLDGSRKVVAVEKAVKPDTYPQSYCYQASYVLELNAGDADKASIRQGVQLEF
jgi:uncharacterized membrane protein (UPF0127 family)